MVFTGSGVNIIMGGVGGTGGCLYGREELARGRNELPLNDECKMITHLSSVLAYTRILLEYPILKPFDTIGTDKKVHRFTNNLQGLQKVMVKDFP